MENHVKTFFIVLSCSESTAEAVPRAVAAQCIQQVPYYWEHNFWGAWNFIIYHSKQHKIKNENDVDRIFVAKATDSPNSCLPARL